jgi:AcrR family transcriptional regulator
MDRQRTAYHHGNARQALIEAANMLLETTGAAGLSLRQLAEQAGLSRQAPYNHFTDKSALLAELVRDGFERLGSGSEAAAALPALSPTERLAKAAESYIAFGQAQPALFRLMFGKEYVDLSQHRAAQEAAHTALAMLSAIIATMAPQAAVPDMTVVAWSLVHGYTSLCIEAGFEENDRRADRARLFARTVSALVGNNAAGGGVHQGTVRPSRSR